MIKLPKNDVFIVLVGHSGSGKDTILKIMEELGFNGVVSYTTRPPRHYEQDGVHYHFLSDEKFNMLLQTGHFAEHAEYRGWHYGMAKQDCKSGNAVIVEPHGLSQLDKILDNVIAIYINTDEEVRFERLRARGDELPEILRRITSDRETFKDVEDRADFIFYNNENDYYNSKDDYVSLKEQVKFFVEDTLIPYLEDM